ncbi:MAG TPA: DsrE family protein [Micropepsaceae bacterium]|nr:DsrE family protein [Micropepsaceae bacterium]
MFKRFRAAIAIIALVIPAFLVGMHTASSQNTPKLHKMVIQVSRDDVEGMNLALGNAVNAKKIYDQKGEQFQVEIVAYGPGITMFREDKSPVKDRLAEVKKEIPGIVYSMCGNAKAAAEKREGHEVVPIAGVGVVPAGIVRVAELQEQGYVYIRP